MAPEQQQAVDAFVRLVQEHYGARLLLLRMFGSRARGDSHEESDLDLAIVLEDGDWQFWDEKRWLAKRAAASRLFTGLHIQAWPIRKSAWDNPQTHRNPAFIENVRRDARELREAA